MRDPFQPSRFHPLRQRFFQVHRSLEAKEHRLLYLFLEITRKCNLNCRHCGSDCTRDFQMPEMTVDSWESVVDYVHSAFDPVPVFVITGGEPLVSPDLDRITRRIGSYGTDWGMVTNGFSLTPEKFNRLQDNGMSSITLSLDGEEDAHRYLRRHSECWPRVLSALSIIGSSSLVVRDVVTCVYAKNFDQLDRIAERLIEAGINSWRLFRIFPKGRAAKDPSLRLSLAQSRALIEWIGDRRPVFQKRGLDLSFSCEGYLPFRLDRKVRREPFFCRSGIHIASILADGTITGCNNNGPDFYQGNIVQDDFKNVWETGFDNLRDRSALRTGICKNCSEWLYCQGGSVHLRTPGKEGPDFCYLYSSED